MDVVTAEDVQAVAPGGELHASAGAIVTPWAREVAAHARVRITPGRGRPAPPAEVAIGADHGGFALKEELKAQLDAHGRALPRPGRLLHGARSTTPTWRWPWRGRCAAARRAWAS